MLPHIDIFGRSSYSKVSNRPSDIAIRSDVGRKTVNDCTISHSSRPGSNIFAFLEQIWSNDTSQKPFADMADMVLFITEHLIFNKNYEK